MPELADPGLAEIEEVKSSLNNKAASFAEHLRHVEAEGLESIHNLKAWARFLDAKSFKLGPKIGEK